MRYTQKRYPSYAPPSKDILYSAPTAENVSGEEIKEAESAISDVLKGFKADMSLAGHHAGASYTRYCISVGDEVKRSVLSALEDGIMLKIGTEVRAVYEPKIKTVYIEIPNKKRVPVYLRSMLEADGFSETDGKLTFCLGKSVTGENVYADLGNMPHLLISGVSGSGKTTLLSSLITGLIMRASPDDIQLIIIDKLFAEHSVYRDIPHLALPIINEPSEAAAALRWAVNEMERRYGLLSKARVRNVDEYLALKDHIGDFEYLPKIVIVIDELSDLMQTHSRTVEYYLMQLAAKSRASGIHLVLSTLRATPDMISGVIKSNIPSRIAFKAATNTDSRAVLEQSGAEKLSRGEMLCSLAGENVKRLQAPYISQSEMEAVAKCVTEKNGCAVFALDTLSDLDACKNVIKNK